MQTTMKSTHTLALRHVLICGVSPSSYATRWIGACICHIAHEGQVEWTTPHHVIKVLHFVLFRSVTCYTNSIVPRIHVNTTKLRISCALWLPQVWYYGVYSVQACLSSSISQHEIRPCMIIPSLQQGLLGVYSFPFGTHEKKSNKHVPSFYFILYIWLLVLNGTPIFEWWVVNCTHLRTDIKKTCVQKRFDHYMLKVLLIILG
jgi:hypothetical protein